VRLAGTSIRAAVDVREQVGVFADALHVVAPVGDDRRDHPGGDGGDEQRQHDPADGPERGLRVVGQPAGRDERGRPVRPPGQQPGAQHREPGAGHDQPRHDQQQPGR
jgi:hypothetical protein